MRRNSLNRNLTIQEKNLKYIIFIKTPVPSYMQEVKKIDEFMLQLLKEKHEKALLAQDLIYENIQKKNLDVKLLQSLEQAKKRVEI